ncbi:cysteine--tRNA ligase [Companilactobacillus muriivasis]|uniref:cysteine--tRNA ligase n=1 Tax=Companilactobacillus muriivasis TaxID=3081444 RepID=UPI0030C704F7
MLKIFNTLTREKEEFKPITPKQVNMYVCGPTVYNYIHIGNARSIVAFDTVRRYLEFLGYNVKFVSNFTDVDDKMIKEANREGITVPEVADRFIKAFYEDIDEINVQRATINPRATDNIQEIIDFIKDLIDKGYAYESQGDVFYRARKFEHYGELSDQNIDQLVEGASEHVGDTEFDKKQDPIDFALWKKAKPNEIKWDSPWGEGRPGWHIECSVMSTKYLGDTFDIHGGGQDLEFPHHENEIAQSEAKTGKKFVNYWMHNGFVTVENNEKMSKSLGNFVTVHDLVKSTNPQVLRFFLSSTHYRRPLEYSQANLQKAADNLDKIKTAYNNLKFRLDGAEDATDIKDTQAQVDKIIADFTDAMNDDFNVQNGLTEIFNLVSLANNTAAQETVAKNAANVILEAMVKLTSILGVNLDEDQQDLSEEIQQMVDARDEARANKDFATSDKLRDQLKDMGVILEDTPQGTRWHIND